MPHLCTGTPGRCSSNHTPSRSQPAPDLNVIFLGDGVRRFHGWVGTCRSTSGLPLLVVVRPFDKEVAMIGGILMTIVWIIVALVVIGAILGFVARSRAAR
jgi:hypothetical protein